MANVIPPDLQKNMRANVRARFMLTSAFVALVCAALVLLMLLPSYAALVQGDSKTSGVAPISASQQALDKAALGQANALLAQLSPIAHATTTPSMAVSEALSLRPKGVSVNQVMYTAGTPATLVVIGTAGASSEISAYRNALASSTVFTSATVPVGALIGADGGSFSITLSGHF